MCQVVRLRTAGYNTTITLQHYNYNTAATLHEYTPPLTQAVHYSTVIAFVPGGEATDGWLGGCADAPTAALRAEAETSRGATVLSLVFPKVRQERPAHGYKTPLHTSSPSLRAELVTSRGSTTSSFLFPEVRAKKRTEIARHLTEITIDGGARRLRILRGRGQHH